MATRPAAMTRSSSSDSSALSNIMVAGTKDEDSSSEGVSASTPPTSCTENGSIGSAKAGVEPMDVIEEETSRRPKRQRSSVSTYNLQKLSDAQDQKSTGSKRNISGLTGRTLVDDNQDESPYGNKTDKAMNTMDWEATPPPTRRSPRTAKVQRRPSVKDRFKKAADKVGSVLGKRSREVMEAGKRKLGMGEIEESPQKQKVLRELDTGSRGVLDEMDLSDDDFVAPARPAKRARTSGKAPLQDVDQTVAPTAPPLNITSGKRTKKWQKEGLYVGQDPGMDPAHVGARKKLQKKRPDSSSSNASEMTDTTISKRTFMTLPMFSYLDKTRDFTIPYDIYAPSYKKGDEKPKDWKQINKNRLVGEARDLWERSEKLPSSACVCKANEGEQGCEDDCLNRVMQYECNDDNCNLDAARCSNRAFAELAARTKKGGPFDLGVEVIKTGNRGFGVRSCRTFAPGQIIMEYTGEIISEAECQRRMREDYKDKQCYYLMELERGLIIDGTKGSMARFINHSCDPNCEVRMVKVNGTPRMAVFAGENGVMTGAELTYDYNFDNFGTTRQICYCGAENCRGFLSKRLNAAEQKKMAREEIERKKKAAEEAMKRAQAEAKKKQVQDDRGSSWRGWIAVDDPEVKEKLKAEKKEREEAEKNSSRAKRLAARLSGVPLVEEKPPTPKREPAKRRKSVQAPKDETKEEPEAESEDKVEQTTIGASVTKTTTRKKHMRTTSTGSKFTEELSRPSSMQTLSTTIKETEVSVSTTEVHKETTRMIDEAVAVAGAELPDREDSTEIPETVSSTESEIQVAEKSGLARTASKGKEVLKGVGQAVKKSFLGIEKSSSSGVGSGKLKQSTLNFKTISS